MTNTIKWCNDNQGFLSVVLSLVAVFAAIGIPAFIAHRQNKIALFDRRFEVYLLLQKISSFHHSIILSGYEKGSHKDQMWCLINWVKTESTYSTPVKAESAILDYFCFEEPLDGEEKAKVIEELTLTVDRESIILKKGEMLYKGHLPTKIKCLTDAYGKFIKSLFDEYFYADGQNKVDSKRDEFIIAADRIEPLLRSHGILHRQLRY
jgi:hypothetical protein